MRQRKTTKSNGGRKDWIIVHQPLEPLMVSRIDTLAKCEKRENRTEMIRVLIERGLAQKETL